MHVLLAFDKFKDALSAPAACAVVNEALRVRHPDWTIDQAPLADGGEGFARLLTEAAGGEWQTVDATGPRAGTRVNTGFGLVSPGQLPAKARARLNLPADKPVAIIKLAGASGLALLAPNERTLWDASTFGTGEVMAAALRAGAGGVLLGLGGSATHDLGLGVLAALGWTFRRHDETTIQFPSPHTWPDLASMSPPPRSTLPPLRIACDVTNPLLGPRGAAAVYAPQKGLQARDGARLESLTRETALKLCSAAGVEADRMDRPGAGAAGGTAFGLHVGAGARLLPGFELVAEWLDLERRIHKADIVITGEGHFDASSMEGKGPGAIAERTRALGKKVVVMAGRITAAQLAPGVQAIALTPPGMTLPEALRHTEANLRRVTHELFAAPRSEDPLP